MADTKDLETRISEARFRLLNAVPFLGYILMKATIQVVEGNPEIQTACVNSRGNITFAREFGDTLSNAQLCFVLAHEVFHPAFGLFGRLKTRNLRMSNIAHDFVINDLITLFEEDRKKNSPNDPALLEHPSKILWDPKYRDMSFEEVYELLMKEQKYSTKEYNQFMDAQGDSEGEGSDADGKGSDADGKQWEITVLEAAQHNDRVSKDGRGYLPNGIRQMISEIIAPKIDWRVQLTRWVGERGRKVDPTYRRPGRRSDSIGEMCPSLMAMFPDIAILWDTSGSMSGDQGRVIAEIADILDNLGAVRIVSCDAAVHADVQATDVYEAMEAAVGGGGSDFNPGFEHLVDSGYRGPVIAITDGMIGVPEYQPEGLDTLWVLVGGHTHTPASWGDTITVDG